MFNFGQRRFDAQPPHAYDENVSEDGIHLPEGSTVPTPFQGLVNMLSKVEAYFLERYRGAQVVAKLYSNFIFWYQGDKKEEQDYEKQETKLLGTGY